MDLDRQKELMAAHGDAIHACAETVAELAVTRDSEGLAWFYACVSYICGEGEESIRRRNRRASGIGVPPKVKFRFINRLNYFPSIILLVFAT